MLEREGKISEGQAGFRPNRSCVDRVYTLGKIIQGRKDAGLTTYCFFLDVQKAYDTVCMEKQVVEKAVGHWDQRKDGENGEEKDRMRQKCYDARRGNIEIL